jgi:hypothetical protein
LDVGFVKIEDLVFVGNPAFSDNALVCLMHRLKNQMLLIVCFGFSWLGDRTRIGGITKRKKKGTGELYLTLLSILAKFPNNTNHLSTLHSMEILCPENLD